MKELEGEGFNNKCMMEYKKLDEIIDNATIDDIKESLRSIWAAIAETRKLRKNRTTEGITEKHLDLRVDKFSIMYSQRLLQLAEAFHTGIEISWIIHLFDQCKNKRNFDDGECLNNFLEAKRIITEKSVAKCNSLGDLEKFEWIFWNHMNTEIYHKKWKEIKDTQDEAVAYESCTSLSQALRGYTQFAYNEEWKKKRYEKIVSLFNIGDLTTEIYKIYDGSDKDVDKRMDFKKAWDEVGETLASDYVYGPLPNEDALPKLRDFIWKHPEYPELKKIYKDAIESERKKIIKNFMNKRLDRLHATMSYRYIKASKTHRRGYNYHIHDFYDYPIDEKTRKYRKRVCIDWENLLTKEYVQNCKDIKFMLLMIKKTYSGINCNVWKKRFDNYVHDCLFSGNLYDIKKIIEALDGQPAYAELKNKLEKERIKRKVDDLAKE